MNKETFAEQYVSGLLIQKWLHSPYFFGLFVWFYMSSNRMEDQVSFSF